MGTLPPPHAQRETQSLHLDHSPGGEGLKGSSRADRVSPVDLPEIALDPVHPLRWTSLAIAFATAYLLVANAVSLDGWLAEQPPGPAIAPLVTAGERWRGATETIGLAAPRAGLHRMWLAAEAARFTGQAAPAPPR